MTILLPQRGPNESAESWIDRALPILSQIDSAAGGGVAVSSGRVYVSPGGGSSRGLLDLGVLATGNIVQVDTTNIEDAAVATAKLADLGITTAKIASGAVTEDELGALSVTEAKLAQLAVTAQKLANGSVTADKIEDGAVTPAKLAPDTTAPGQTTTLSASGGFQKIVLTWTSPGDGDIDYFEVYRNTTDDRASSVKIAEVKANVYSDDVGTGVTRFYWVRAVDTSGNIGDWNATAGTSGTTAQIVTGELANLAITAGKIADGSIDLTAATKITGQLSTVNLADAAVTTGKLAALSVTAAELAAAAVTEAKINAGAVTESKIASASITSAKIGTAAVGTAAIANLAVTNAKIGNLAVNTAQIADAAVESAKIGIAAVGTAAIQTAAITTALIADANITGAKILDATIDNAKISDLSAAKISAGTISAGAIYLGQNQIELDGANSVINIADQQAVPVTRVQLGKLGAGTSDYGVRIYDASGSEIVGNNGLGSDVVDSAQIVNAAVGTAAIANAAITTALIADANVTTAKIANLAVGSAQINDAAIVTAKIGSLAVTSAKINDMAANKIIAGTIGVNQVYVGGTQFELKGLDTQMVIRDAQGSPVDRIVLGRFSAGSTDYGMKIYDASGGLIMDVSDTARLYGDNITTEFLKVTDDGGGSNPAIKIEGSGLDAIVEFGSDQRIKGGTNNDLSIEGSNLDQVFVAGSELSVTSTNGLAVSNKASINSSAAAVAVTQSYATNGSFTGNVISLLADRAASTAYGFLTAVSSNSGSSDTEFILRGDGNAFADGSWSGGGADYAEYFESASGKAIPPGTPVVLDGDKIKPATSATDDIIGVVRPEGVSAAIGNASWNYWRGKHERDQWGKKVTETVDAVQWVETVVIKPAGKPFEADSTKDVQRFYYVDDIPDGVVVPDDAERFKTKRPKVAVSYDSDTPYVPRSDRPEWNIIGLVGQVEVLKNAPVNPRWVKMGSVNGNLDRWFIR